MPIHPFEAALSIIGTCVGAVIVLTLFFRTLRFVDARMHSVLPSRSLPQVLLNRPLVRVSLSNGQEFDDVRIDGFIHSENVKGPMPYELNGMVILRHADSRQTLAHAKLIRMIEIPALPEEG